MALDADGVIRALSGAGLPERLTVTYTAATDPNHLLGRPNGYTSKAAFSDARVKAASVTDPSLGSVDLGGSVEVYPSQFDAVARARYIQHGLQAFAMLGTEYDFVAGPVLLRVSGYLTPAQAWGYKTALATATGDTPDLITVQ